MNAPIISSEGLLRLASLVERLRSRDQGEGGASWTARTRQASTEHDDADPGGTGVGGATGDEASRGCPDLEYLVGTDGDRDATGDDRRRR